MSDWTIRLPVRDRSDSIAEITFDARFLGEEDGKVTRHLVVQPLLDGDRTVGDLIDRVERADPAERRRMLDAARQAAGL
jgi:hypothetical protein